MICCCNAVLLLAVLYERHISIFFFRRFNSAKDLPQSLGKEIVSNLTWISSRMYKRIPLLAFLLNFIGTPYHLIVNWLYGNVESNFVSEIINIFKLTLMLFESISYTAQKMKFSIRDFFSKSDQIPLLPAFTEEILNGKLIFFAVEVLG